jgi:hypothetical protein
MAKDKIDWSASSCCGAKVIKVAGIRRCEKCQREVKSYDSSDYRGPYPMYDIHDRNYTFGEDE